MVGVPLVRNVFQINIIINHGNMDYLVTRSSDILPHNTDSYTVRSSHTYVIIVIYLLLSNGFFEALLLFPHTRYRFGFFLFKIDQVLL